MVQQQAPVSTFVSGFGDASRQQPCFSAFLLGRGVTLMDAFIGHPDGIPESDVRHAATRSAGRRKPVNIRNAVKSSGIDRRAIVVLPLRYHGIG
jgi:hypothetical protein